MDSVYKWTSGSIRVIKKIIIKIKVVFCWIIQKIPKINSFYYFSSVTLLTSTSNFVSK